MTAYDNQNVFAKILRGELPAQRVYEDDRCIVILDIFPVNPGHLLVVPKEAGVLVTDLSPETLGHLMTVGARMSQLVRQAAPRCEGVSFWISDGAAGGQEVPHVHLHVIPRFSGDGFGWKKGPNNALAANQDDLKTLADRYRKTLETL